MTSNIRIQQYVDYIINVINGLRYDEDGEIVEEASRTMKLDEDFFNMFDDIKWEIAERIGYDRCHICAESDGYVCFEVVGFEDGDLEYDEIKLGEEFDVTVSVYMKLKTME